MTDENLIEETNITDIFNDDEPNQNLETEPKQDEIKGEEDNKSGESEKGEDKPVPPTEEKEVSEQNDNNSLVPRHALIDERRKRQEAERQLESLQSQHNPIDEEAPDPVQDPKAYEDYITAKVRNRDLQDRTNQSREAMLEKHSDYIEKESIFFGMMQQNPSLAEQARKHHDPALFAYETATTRLNELMSASEASISEKLEKSIIERLEKEGRLKPAVDKNVSSAVEASNFINATGSGKNSESTVKEIETIEDIFDR